MLSFMTVCTDRQYECLSFIEETKSGLNVISFVS